MSDLITERPPWAPHVRATYPPRVVDEDGKSEQVINMYCEHALCAATNRHYRVVCTSGAVRGHIATFALVHAHRDPFG